MYFFNIRRKFATNSSSSHSMIVLETPSNLKDVGHGGDGYGWDNFVLSSTDKKKHYLSSLFHSALAKYNGDAVASAVLKDLGLTPNDEGVDHQSIINLPLSPDQSSAHVGFAKELMEWALRPDVVVLGGNDNEADHPLSGEGVQVSLRNWLAQEKLVAWKDDSNGLWSLYSRKNGLTLRFSFDDMSEAYVLDTYRRSETRAGRPNLVDVKITDKCPFQCTYCYQGSTPQGVHGQLVDIVRIASKLAEEEVFEVAIGGGEPTLHPDFEQIVDVFHARGITPSFTTRNLTFLKNDANKALLEKCGGVAISVDNPSDAKKAIEAIESLGRTQIQTSVQLVVGTQTEQQFRDMVLPLIEKNVSLTFLGYKTTGFGAKFQEDNLNQVEQASTHWLTWLKEVQQEYLATKTGYKPNLWISIDTALAQLSDDLLKKDKIAENLYHRTEGTQSMYIDAVNNTMGASSFSNDMHPFDEAWLDRFATFAPTKKKTKKP